jgi:hypothetical protein
VRERRCRWPGARHPRGPRRGLRRVIRSRPHRGPHHQHDLVGLTVHERAGHRVALGRGVEDHRCRGHAGPRARADPVDRLGDLPRAAVPEMRGTRVSSEVASPRPSPTGSRATAPFRRVRSPRPSPPRCRPSRGTGRSARRGRRPNSSSPEPPPRARRPSRGPCRPAARRRYRCAAAVPNPAGGGEPTGDARSSAGRSAPGQTEHADLADRPAVGLDPRVRARRLRTACPICDRNASSPAAPNAVVPTPRAAPSTVPSRSEQRGVDLRAATVDREQRRRVTDALQLVDRDETSRSARGARRGSPRSRRPSPPATCGAGPRAVTVVAHATDHVVGDRGTGPPGLPISTSTSQWTLRYPRSVRTGEDPGVVVPGAERAAEPRPRVDAGRRFDRVGAVVEVPHGARRRRARGGARGSASGAPRGAPRRPIARATSGCGLGHRPWTKKVRAHNRAVELAEDPRDVAGRAPRPVGVLRVERERHPWLIHGSSPSSRGL